MIPLQTTSAAGRLTLSCLLLPLLTLLWSGPASATEYHLYFLGGQSNMEGFGRQNDLPAELDRVIPGAMIFHGNSAPDGGPVDGRGVWSRLRPGHGVGYRSDGTSQVHSDRFGVELTFASRLRALNPDTEIAIIKYSRGGSSIDCSAAGNFGCWDPDDSGTNQYDHFLATVLHATAITDIDGDGEQDTLVPTGIVWMQGESDGAYTEAIARRYRGHLERLMGLIRTILRRDDLPVAIGRISDSGRDHREKDGKVWNHGAIVRAAQANFVEQDGHAALVTATDDYSYSDPWHYDSTGYLDLGRRFAEAIAGLADRSSSQVPDPDPVRFQTEIDAFVHWQRKNDAPRNPVLFVGSSSIRLWSTAQDFPQLPVVNRGFGGAHISDVQHFYDTLVLPHQPSVVVFYAGDNDIAAGKSPHQVFDDFQAFAERLWRDFPTSHLLYLPIKPSLSRWHHWPAMDETNSLIRTWAESAVELQIVDVATPMLGDDGKPRPELFVDDGLHLNETGYELWRSILKPQLAAAYEEVVKP